MATNLSLDPELLELAFKIGGFKTKKDTVNTALLEFIQHRKRLEAIKHFGTIDYDPDYDYKAERRRR